MSAGADFFHDIGGTMSEDAPSYVERPADAQLLTALDRQELCLVLAPRQTGKSSLMVHALAALRERRTRAGIVDFQLLGGTKSLEQLFSDILTQLKASLRLRADVMRWWEGNRHHGPTQRFTVFLEQVVLAEVDDDEKVVIFFDEIDSLVKLPFSDDFFTTLRYIRNARAFNEKFRRLNFVIIGVATQTSFIKDSTRTPFNIGTQIQLTDFDRDEVAPFRRVLGDDRDELIERIFHWTRGQPLLVQKLAAVAYRWPPEKRTAARLDEEVVRSYGRGTIRQDAHLKFIESYLLDESHNVRRTLKTYERVLKGERVPNQENSPVQIRLKLAGVVRDEGGRLVPRNLIYQRIFDLDWVKAHRPTDVARWAAAAAACVAAFALAWPFVLRPLLFPRFPDLKSIAVNTHEPSVVVEVNVGRIPFAKVGDESVTVASNGLLRFTLRDLPVGESTRDLVLSGLLPGGLTVPVRAVYYPGWMARQFPDARLGNFGEIVEVQGVEVLKRKGVKVAGEVFKDSEELAGGETFVSRSPVDGREVARFNGHRGLITKVVRSPNGHLLCSISEDKTLRLWRANTGEALGTKDEPSGFSDVAFSEDGQHLFAVSRRGAIYRLNLYFNQTNYTFSLLNEQEAKNSPPAGQRFSLALSRDKKFMAVGDNRRLSVRDFYTAGLVEKQPKESGGVLSVAFSPDKLHLATGRGRSAFFDTPNIQIAPVGEWQTQRILGLTSDPLALAYPPDKSATLAAGLKDGKVILWNVKDGDRYRELGTFAGPGAEREKAPVVKVGFSSDGQLVQAQSAGGETKIWDVESGSEVSAFAGHAAEVTSLLFAPDGTTFASLDGAGGGRVWDVRGGLSLHTFRAPGPAAYAPNGRALLLREGNALTLWSLDSRGATRSFEPGGEVVHFAFSSGGDRVLSLSGLGKVTVWDVDGGRETKSFSVPRRGGPVAFSPNGKLLLAVGAGGALELWDVERGSLEREFPEVREASYLTFSPDNKKFLARDSNDVVTLWNIDTRASPAVFPATPTTRPFGFSPDGQRVLLNLPTGIHVRDIERNQELSHFNETVWAFSPDGKLLALWSGSSSVVIYGVEDGKAKRTFVAPSEPIVAAVFSHDGRQVLTASRDNIMRLWWAELGPRD